jgi:hypothetical protein
VVCGDVHFVLIYQSLFQGRLFVEEMQILENGSEVVIEDGLLVCAM